MVISEPNVYQLLELDPDQPWNPVEFERQLQAKRQEWSRRINVPGKQGSEARTNLGLIPVLQKIATDPEQLKLQAAAVRAARVATVAEKQEQLEEHLTLLQIKGYLLEAEFKRLVMDFKEIATEPEIKRRITTPIRPAAPAKPTRPALEPTKAQEIETKLKQLSKTDLYDFLGLGHSTANSLLWQKANELYAGVQKKATKTPTDTHISELSGHCLVIFKTDAERARYDETLRLLGYKSLLAKVEIMAREIKRLEPEQIDRLLREAKAMGLDPDEALEAIMNYAAEKKYTILSISPVQTVRELQRCGDCHHINDKNARRCTNCGKPLKILCPKCAKSEVASDEKACSQCGFPTGNAGWVNLLIEEARQAALQEDYKTALQRLNEAHDAWPLTRNQNVDYKELQTATQKDYETALQRVNHALNASPAVNNQSVDRNEFKEQPNALENDSFIRILIKEAKSAEPILHGQQRKLYKDAVESLLLIRDLKGEDLISENYAAQKQQEIVEDFLSKSKSIKDRGTIRASTGEQKKGAGSDVPPPPLPRGITYRNFDLQLSLRADGQLQVQILASPTGQASDLTTLPPYRLSDLEIKYTDASHLGCLSNGMTPDNFRDMAKMIGQALLPDRVRQHFTASLRQAKQSQQHQKGLCIRIAIDDPVLAAIPWEITYFDDYLSLDKHTPVVRYIQSDHPSRRLVVQRPLFILGIRDTKTINSPIWLGLD